MVLYFITLEGFCKFSLFVADGWITQLLPLENDVLRCNINQLFLTTAIFYQCIDESYLHILIIFLQINFVKINFNNSPFVLLWVLVHFIHKVMQCIHVQLCPKPFFPEICFHLIALNVFDWWIVCRGGFLTPECLIVIVHFLLLNPFFCVFLKALMFFMWLLFGPLYQVKCLNCVFRRQRAVVS